MVTNSIDGQNYTGSTTLFLTFSSICAMIVTSMFTKDFPSCTAGIIRKGRLMLLVTRYLINSNSPSGGIKVMDLSASNFPKRTHR